MPSLVIIAAGSPDRDVSLSSRKKGRSVLRPSWGGREIKRWESTWTDKIRAPNGAANGQRACPYTMISERWKGSRRVGASFVNWFHTFSVPFKEKLILLPSSSVSRGRKDVRYCVRSRELSSGPQSGRRRGRQTTASSASNWTTDEKATLYSTSQKKLHSLYQHTWNNGLC